MRAVSAPASQLEDGRAIDTAGSAREIADRSLAGQASVCGEYSPRLYGLEIPETGIETNKLNFTRFVILADPLLSAEIGHAEREKDTAWIVFTLTHTNGALSKVLTILSFGT